MSWIGNWVGRWLGGWLGPVQAYVFPKPLEDLAIRVEQDVFVVSHTKDEWSVDNAPDLFVVTTVDTKYEILVEQDQWESRPG